MGEMRRLVNEWLRNTQTEVEPISLSIDTVHEVLFPPPSFTFSSLYY